jgi:hypothetical protein
MKIIYILIALFFFICIKSNAQTWQWTHPEINPDANSRNYAHDVEVDSSGNVYVLGSYWDSLYLGGNFKAKGYGSYLAKYNSAGTLLWYKLITADPSTAGTYPDIFASDMVVNANGIFITGRYVPTSYYDFNCDTHIFSGTYLKYKIGSLNFTSNYNELGFFLTKFNTSGAVVWNKLGTYDVCSGLAGAGSFDSKPNITSDKNSNITASFIIGTNDLSSVSIGGDIIPIQSGYTVGQLVVVKYSGAGALKWSTYAGGFFNTGGGGTGFVRDCNSSAVDNNGNIFFYGTAMDSTFFGSNLFRTSSPKDGDYLSSTFIAKLSSSGVWQFAKELYNGSSNVLGGNIGNNTGNPDLLAVDGSNNVYALVNAGGTIILGDTIEHGGNFLVKMTNSGSLVWDKFFGLPTEPYCSSICYYNNNLYITGSIRSSNISTYLFSDLYTQFYSIYNYGYFQSFAGKADLNGNFQWVTGVGGNDNVSGWGVKAYQDNIYTCGVYNYDITTLGNLNSASPTNAYSIFFGKLKDQYIKVGGVTPTALNAGCTITIPFTSHGLTFSNNNTFTAEISDISGDFTNATVIGSVQSKNSGTITATIPANLSYGSGYRIRIHSSDTLKTGYSYYAYADTDYKIKLLCPPPTGLTNTNITSSSAKLNWHTVDCAKGYRLKYKLSTASTWTTINIPTNIGTYTLTDLTANTTYKWKLATKCKPDNTAHYSKDANTHTFTTTAAGFAADDVQVSQLKTSGITVYPNPANNNAVILFNTNKTEKYQLELTDISGKVLQTKTGETIKGENKIVLNVSKYAQGMYVIHLTDDEHGTRTLKLNKQ